MFTGIIEQVGTIQKIEGNIFTLQCSFDKPFAIGDSLAVSGACMTILSQTDTTVSFEAMEESRNKTTLGGLKSGDRVNLERSAIIGGRNSGHTVTGHIDELGKILSVKKVHDFWLVRVSFSSQNDALVVPKGSVTVEGISLTISRVSEKGDTSPFFEVSLLSHTWTQTNLSDKKEGDWVNLEFDILGKYIQRSLGSGVGSPE